jgi:hypothetical protein
MIAVVADASDEPVVREFFELFKTPWEFYRAGKAYDVVLCDGSAKVDGISARLHVVYGSVKTNFEAERNLQVHSRQAGAELSFLGNRFPVYGDVITFTSDVDVLKERNSGKAALYLDQTKKGIVARIGYDLFSEIRTLLTKGQPAENSAMPTLDLHVQLLRDLITCSGIPLAEIPPIPVGHPFIACLTHDLDHASIRRHKLDSTILGFLYRATVGSVVNVARRRAPLRKLVLNWTAVAKLPFIYLGVAKDIWFEFDRYLDLEGGRPSTFFVVPFENRPGRSSKGNAPPARATRYDVSHIAPKIPRLLGQGCEVGLHGIDAWYESSRGREESQRISEISKTTVSGVRMHWLYSDEKSANVLDEAGFSYDSTVGYNETIGYRAGTAQVFRPFQVRSLLELPMLVMDTALFYPSSLNLSESEAWTWVAPVFDRAVESGGVVTVNWHDRSIAPERQWDGFYRRLIAELTARGAWFCTAGRAVSWFRLRRSASFVSNEHQDKVNVSVQSDKADGLPGLRLRLHRPRPLSTLGRPPEAADDIYTDTAFSDRLEVCVTN